MDQVSNLPVSSDDEDERDRQFNAYRYAASEGAQAIVLEAIRSPLRVETREGLRKNKRRPADQATFEMTINANRCR
jgi:hypothetical protein